MAIQKVNGLWCENRALKVKQTDFAKNQGAKPRLPYVKEVRKDEKLTYATVNLENRKKSYAQVVGEGRMRDYTSLTIRAYEEGNGWLYGSAIVRLKLKCS
ncbi:hypothetical protein ACSBR1_016063 [Camellia fascicularis]